MKKKQLLATLVMLSLMQGSVYAKDITAETQEEYNAVAANDSLILTGDNNTVNIGAEGANITGDVITAGSGNNNTLTITDSNFNNVYGANDGENAVANAVTINGNSVIGIETEEDEDRGYNYSVIGGQAAANGQSSQNNVVINGGTFEGTVAGGLINLDDENGTGSATNNKVIINGGYFKESDVEQNPTDSIQGGRAVAGDANNNEVYIYGGSFEQHIKGGVSKTGNASQNKVVIGEINDSDNSNDDIHIYRQVYGGSVKNSNGGNANYNVVEIHGGTFGKGGNIHSSGITGGWAASTNADYNEVLMDGGKLINDSLIGGQSYGKGSASYNKVTLAGDGYVGVDVWGGSSISGLASYNEVWIKDNAQVSGVVGGRSSSGTSELNTVNVINGTIDIIYGGYSSGKANVLKNKVNLQGGIVNEDIYGGRSSSGEVSGNIVNISGGTVDGYVYSGKSDGAVNNNEIYITDGTINGGVYGAKTDKEIKNNKVYVSGGTVEGFLMSGWGGDSLISENNEVVISGGDINATVYAGYGSNTLNNKLILTGSADVEDSKLYGTNKNGQTGNNLVIDGWKGKTEKVGIFENIDFTNTKWETNGVILDITNVSNNALADTHINLNDMTVANGEKLSVGDKMTFIQSNVDTGLDMDNIEEKAAFTQGVATVGEGEVQLEGETNNLVYKITEVKRNEQTDLVAENRAVAAAFINHGTDLIAYALDTLGRDDTYGIKTFAAVQGERTKYDVNSDIKINGWNTLVGVGNENEHNDGDFSWGVFYENGSANYRTYNNFNNEFFRGDGSLVYNGGGIAARYENEHGVYTEGSLRAGMLKSEMNNALRDGNGNNYGFKSESAYYGAHIGVGQIMLISEDSELDIYGKFFHTYTEGDSFDVGGEDFEFDGVTSDRLRLGARVTTNKDNSCNTYYGLAYEYEFSGDAVMRVAGMSAPEQSLQGSSCFAEIGLNYRETPDSPWNLDMNVRGYTGERQGVSFYAQATYTF